MHLIRSALVSTAIGGLAGCSSIHSTDDAAFDPEEYRSECMKNVVAELFTTGTTKAPDRMPQEKTDGFPIALGSPMVYAMITNFRDGPVRLEQRYLQDSLFATNRRGEIESEFSVFPPPTGPDVVIAPGETYTLNSSLPPIGKTGVFWIRMNGIYTEPLRVRYRD